MAHEYGTEPVWKTAVINEFGGKPDNAPRRHHHAATPYAQAAELAHAKPTSHDVASVLGLPFEQVSPEILAALAPLLAELEHLRFEHDQSTRRAVALQRLADRHSVLPCMNRRAFMRELDSFMVGGGRGVLAVMHAGGIERLRRLHGLAAGEGALRHVCATFLNEMRQSDMLGCVGGSDFAVLLPACGIEDALAKLADTCRRVNDPAFSWMGQVQALETLCGFHEITQPEDAESALAAADRQRRGLDGAPVTP